MVNPDGVDLVNGYFDADSTVYRAAKDLAENYPAISSRTGGRPISAAST